MTDIEESENWAKECQLYYRVAEVLALYPSKLLRIDCPDMEIVFLHEPNSKNVKSWKKCIGEKGEVWYDKSEYEVDPPMAYAIGNLFELFDDDEAAWNDLEYHLNASLDKYGESAAQCVSINMRMTDSEVIQMLWDTLHHYRCYHNWLDDPGPDWKNYDPVETSRADELDRHVSDTYEKMGVFRKGLNPSLYLIS
jgi:hypothetical protein